MLGQTVAIAVEAIDGSAILLAPLDSSNFRTGGSLPARCRWAGLVVGARVGDSISSLNWAYEASVARSQSQGDVAGAGFPL